MSDAEKSIQNITAANHRFSRAKAIARACKRWLQQLERPLRAATPQRWKTVVYVCSFSALYVLIINAAVTIWVTAKYEHDNEWIATAYEGRCDVTAAWTRWLHVGINILSSILLSCSNYCMQFLVAPTRAELDLVHSKKKSVEIGVPSVRNLGLVPFKRVALWWLLALSSIPLHFLYNSAVFQTLAATSYAVAVIDESIIDGGTTVANTAVEDYFSTSIRALQRSLSDGRARDPQKFTNLSNADCIKAYSVQYQTERKNVFAVTSSGDLTNGTLFLLLRQTPSQQFISFTDQIGVDADINEGDRPIGYQSWLCSDRLRDCERSCTDAETYPNDECPTTAGAYFACNLQGCDWSTQAERTNDWTVGGYPISYCLSEPLEEKCELQFSLSILLTIIICNLVKLICMFLCSKVTDLESQPLVTLGDAVASFLKTPDRATAGLCLSQGSNFSYYLNRGPRPWRLKKRFWFAAASILRWLSTLIPCILTIIVSSNLLRKALSRLWSGDRSLPALSKLGLGAVRSDSYLDVGLTGIIPHVLLANLPQAIISFLYLLYNALFTSMLLEKEWASLARHRKPLRVSQPQGEQRSTYYLQLPYRYAVPMVAVMTTLHWLVSQSLFVVRIKFLDQANGTETGLGYSCIAIVLSVLLGVLMLLVCVGTGFRRFNGDMPLARCSSFAISAACHRPDDDVDADTLPVMWGEVSTGESEIGHCCITSHDVSPPTVGRLYS